MLFTYQEFIDAGGSDEVVEDDFNGLLKRSQRMIDAQIGYDVEGQHEKGFISEYAFDFYKDAVLSQIEYIHFVGIRDIAGKREVQDVKVGNFAYTSGSTRSGGLIEQGQFGAQVFDYLIAGGFIGGAVDVRGY